jgi:organic hydroperoxide reductase OsmC/OhrA
MQKCFMSAYLLVVHQKKNIHLNTNTSEEVTETQMTIKNAKNLIHKSNRHNQVPLKGRPVENLKAQLVK